MASLCGQVRTELIYLRLFFPINTTACKARVNSHLKYKQVPPSTTSLAAILILNGKGAVETIGTWDLAVSCSSMTAQRQCSSYIRTGTVTIMGRTVGYYQATYYGLFILSLDVIKKL